MNAVNFLPANVEIFGWSRRQRCQASLSRRCELRGVPVLEATHEAPELSIPFPASDMVVLVGVFALARSRVFTGLGIHLSSADLWRRFS